MSRAVGIAAQMVGVVVLARLLSPSDFGLVAMVAAITEIFYLFKDLGLSYATIQERRINHDQISTLFWVNAAFGFAVTLLVMLLAPAIAWFYHEPQLKLITAVSSLNFLFIGLSTQHLALLKRNMAFVQISIIEIMAAILSTALAIVLAWQGWGFWSLVYRPLILGFLTTVGVWLFCRWRPGRPAGQAGALLRFGANTLVGYFFDYVTLNLDKVLIGRKYGSDQIGYYQRAVYLSKVASDTLTMSLTNVAVAALSKLREQPAHYRRFYLRGLSVISFLGLPLSVFMFVMSKDIVLVVLGPKWDQTAVIFSILSLSTGIYLIYNTNGWLHISLGRADRFRKWSMGAAIVYFAAIVVGISFGVKGVAVAYAAVTFLLTIPCLLYAGKPIGLGFSDIGVCLWRFLLAAAFAGIACRWLLFPRILMEFLVLSLIGKMAAFGVVYLVFITALYGGFGPILEFVSLLRRFRDQAPGRGSDKGAAGRSSAAS